MACSFSFRKKSMLRRTLSATLIAASFTASCAVGPDYVRPAMPLSDRYMGQTAVDARPATANADLLAWWTGFGDAQLARFVTLALAQNLDLAQASARVTQARAGLGAANAALLPSGVIVTGTTSPEAVRPLITVTSSCARSSIGISFTPSRIVQSMVECGSAT